MAGHAGPATQEPVVWPLGTWHMVPTQQSAVDVHGALSPPQRVGATHCPAVHTPEQQSLAVPHAAPFPLQTGPASGVPASGVPPSVGGSDVMYVQNAPLSPWMHAASLQHCASLVHTPPGGVQASTAAHLNPPSGDGRHGASPQHWSRNWQEPPAGMQHPGTSGS
jgi:hypothetical protein